MTESASVLAALDEQQRAAARQLRGPVSILAGAGAGKTRTITHRIAHGVLTGTYAPDKIMALSFTKKAAGELQTRLHALGVRGVNPKTFHAAALSQLGYFWNDTIGGNAPALISSKAKILTQILAKMAINADKQLILDLAAEIEWRKVSMLTLESYETVADKRAKVSGIEPQKLVEIMQSYEDLKRERFQIDFEDVLLLLAGMLNEEPRVADIVRGQYRFFTVDEYQDVSPLQQYLLKTWLGDREDLCVVGDVSQTIYSFAGATGDYLRNFTHEFKNGVEFKLETNYRSVPEIITLANNLMSGESGALTLKPFRESLGFKPAFEWFENEKQEAAAVAAAIKTKLVAGQSASSFAVLFRSHAYSLHIEQALKAAGINVKIQAGTRYFDRADVKRAVMEIRAQALAGDARPVFQVVSDVLRGQGWSSKPPEGGINELEKWEVLNALLNLVDEMPKQTSLKEFSEDLLRRSRSDHEPTLEAVTLSTIHAAKGLEWPYVWIIGAAEGNIPITYAKTDEMIAEEKRLFYVALTRAETELRVSGAGKASKMPSRFLDQAKLFVA